MQNSLDGLIKAETRYIYFKMFLKLISILAVVFAGYMGWLAIVNAGKLI